MRILVIVLFVLLALAAGVIGYLEGKTSAPAAPPAAIVQPAPSPAPLALAPAQSPNPVPFPMAHPAPPAFHPPPPIQMPVQSTFTLFPQRVAGKWQGFRVVRLNPGSPLQSVFGLQRNDVVIAAIDGTGNRTDLSGLPNPHAADAAVLNALTEHGQLIVDRGAQELTLPVTEPATPAQPKYKVWTNPGANTAATEHPAPVAPPDRQRIVARINTDLDQLNAAQSQLDTASNAYAQARKDAIAGLKANPDFRAAAAAFKDLDAKVKDAGDSASSDLTKQWIDARQALSSLKDQAAHSDPVVACAARITQCRADLKAAHDSLGADETSAMSPFLKPGEYEYPITSAVADMKQQTIRLTVLADQPVLSDCAIEIAELLHDALPDDLDWKTAEIDVVFNNNGAKQMGMRATYLRGSFTLTDLDAMIQANQSPCFRDQPVVRVAKEFWLNPDLAAGQPLVAKGMTRAQVLDALGPPSDDSIQADSETLEWRITRYDPGDPFPDLSAQQSSDDFLTQGPPPLRPPQTITVGCVHVWLDNGSVSDFKIDGTIPN